MRHNSGMMAKHSPYILYLVLLLVATVTEQATVDTEKEAKYESMDDDQALIISPSRLAIQKGNEGIFHCKMSNVSMVWMNENGTLVENLNNTRFAVENNGTFTIFNSTIEDSGTYVCVSQDRKWNGTALLKVYIMPDYYIQGMIIVGVNAALLLVFIILSVVSYVKNRQITKQTKLATFNHD